MIYFELFLILTMFYVNLGLLAFSVFMKIIKENNLLVENNIVVLRQLEEIEDIYEKISYY